MHRFLLVSTVLILQTLSAFSKEQLIYTRISQNEGLSSTINCIHKELHAEVWLGGTNGLYSFNGNLLRYISDPFLDGRKVLKITSDKEGNFWVLTDRSLLRRKRGEDKFTLMTGQDIYSPFNSICMNEEGIWFGSSDKIYRYTFHDDSFGLFTKIQGENAFDCQHMDTLNDTTIICGSQNGIITVDARTGAVPDSPFNMNKEVSALLTDRSGNIWIASYNKGIEVFSQNGELIGSYNTSNSKLSNNIVLCMTENDSRIWAGTDGGGINIIDHSNNSIQTLTHIAGDSASLPTNSIKSIYTDNSGNIWAGSIRDGLIKISYSGIKSYRDSHIGTSSGLSNPSVLFLFNDKSTGYIWIGTDGEGINRFDPSTKKFLHFPSTLKKKVVSIAEYSDDELVLSVYSDRMWIFNKHTGAIRPLEIQDKDINYILKYSGRSINLVNDKDGNLLFIGNFVSLFDKTTGQCIKYRKEDRKNVAGNLFVIGQDECGLILHDNFSIYKIRNGSTTIETLGKSDNFFIRSGYLGKDGAVWLATDIGLCRFSTEDASFSLIGTSLFHEATSVVADSHSRIWIGSGNSLYAYLADEGTFALFGKSDGAAPNEYLPKPRLLASNGDVYLGGAHGLLRINEDYVIDESDEPQISLESFSVDDVMMKVNSSDPFKISPGSKTMDINVSVSEKDILRQKFYRFSLSGNSINQETSRPLLHIQQIPAPGTHEIYVSCTKRNGEWTEPVKILTLVVPKPWYKTWLFITGCALAIILIILLIIVSMLRQKEHKMRLAMKEKDQQLYEEKLSMLINISHELRTPLTLVMAPLKRLLKGTSDQDENYDTLLRIYRQAGRMKDLINMVLDLRKMEEGKDHLKIESIDFNRWILETTEDIAHEEHSVGIALVFDLDESIGNVEFDKRKCDTVLTNILMNAVKHSKSGDTITIRTRLTEEGYVRTYISDQGPGLGDADEKKIFARFYQSNSESYGSGIGLSYSKILVDLHGGNIIAENNPDKGATFWWEIPVKALQSDMDEIPAKAYFNELIGYNTEKDVENPESEAFITSDMKLMLVDDNIDLLDFLRESLCSEFAEVMTVQSGNTALEKIRAGKFPDLIISDINMPDGDGFRLCKEIKNNDKLSHIPVILLTARDEGQSQGDSYKVGADAFLAKPFEIEILMDLIRNLLKKKAQIRKKYLDINDEASAEKYGSAEEKFIIQLNKVIYDNLGNSELDQQLLCREMGMSRALLYNKMKAITGTGAKEYITRIRIEKAKSLIESTDLTIAEISEITGFASQSYFSTAFKNYTGAAPSRYKQDIRKVV